MLILDKPYFMTNDEWFELDSDECKYVLTDKVPQEAIKSYEEFYNQLESTTIYE